MKLHDRFPKVRLPLWATLLAAVLLAGAITLLALWCQPNALRSVLAVFRSQPLLIVLNCLPVGMLLLAFTCLFRNVFFGAALVNFAVHRQPHQDRGPGRAGVPPGLRPAEGSRQRRGDL